MVGRSDLFPLFIELLYWEEGEPGGKDTEGDANLLDLLDNMEEEEANSNLPVQKLGPQMFLTVASGFWFGPRVERLLLNWASWVQQCYKCNAKSMECSFKI